MKATNIFFIALILTFISMSIMAQTSQVTYDNPNHTSGSLTLSPADCQFEGWSWGWEIDIPTSTPIKLTSTINLDSYLQIYTNDSGLDNYIFDDYGPGSNISTVFSTSGKIFIYAENDDNGIPSNSVFTINFSVDNSYTMSQNTSVAGNAIIGKLDVKGDALLENHVGIGITPLSYSKLMIYNIQNPYSIYNLNSYSSSNSTYGIFTQSCNYSGPVYGLYSSVYGGGAQNRRWAGYFNGGDIELNGGDIFQNSDNSVITVKDDNIGIVKKSGSSAVWGVGSTYCHRFGKWSTLTLRGNVSAGTFTEQMRIANNGYVGIGTSTPDQALTVKGKIHANEVIIDMNYPIAVPDFVFKPTYKLMPLSEVEQYVKKNSHLPEIKSAGEITKNGMSVGEMQNKLLQKVEELTLYMIEQQKTINQQSAKIDELEKKMK